MLQLVVWYHWQLSMDVVDSPFTMGLATREGKRSTYPAHRCCQHCVWLNEGRFLSCRVAEWSLSLSSIQGWISSLMWFSPAETDRCGLPATRHFARPNVHLGRARSARASRCLADSGSSVMRHMSCIEQFCRISTSLIRSFAVTNTTLVMVAAARRNPR